MRTQRILFLLAGSVLAFCLSMNGQIPKQAAAPDGIPKSPVDQAAEAYVVEQLRTSLRIENDGTGVRETYGRVRVQSEAGVQQWGQLIIGYNSAHERVEISHIRVKKAGGSVVTAPADAVRDLSAPLEREAPVYTDLRQKHVTVPGLRPGETLEYQFSTIVKTPFAPGHFWADHNFDTTSIVLDEQLEINLPGDRTIKLKSKPGNEPNISEESGRRIYRWATSHLQREEDGQAREKGEKKRKAQEPQAPAVQLTTFGSWEEVGRWYSELERDRRTPSPEIKAKAEELTKGLASDMEKVEALYDYVAKNFRYVSLSLGIGRYQPHAAAEILHNEYGDCKDKHTLLAALLEAEGLHASSVLINTSRKLDPDVPSPSQFDHIITFVPVEKQEVWLDTTTEVAPFRMLALPLRDKQALIMPPQGPAHLVYTPAGLPMATIAVQEVSGRISDAGKLDARVRYSVRGDAELLMRTVFRRVPKAQWSRVVEAMSAMLGLAGEVSNLEVADPAGTRQAFNLSYRIESANFVDWSKKKSEVPLPLAEVGLPADVDDDAPATEPIKLGAPGELVYRLALELPTRYAARIPLPVSVKRSYAEYEAAYKLDEHKLTAERKLVLTASQIPSGTAQDFLAFQKAVRADADQRLVLESAGSSEPPKDLKADDLNERGWAALQNGDLVLAADLLKRAVDADPKHKLAWNNLGRAYMAMVRLDEAVAAFRKQIEVNPFDEYAYNNLGRVYQIKRSYDQAAAMFQKQIEINPLDKWAHANLGGLYLEQKKYEDAVPELEKAARLTPENPMLQLSLGTAYLNMGQDENAITAFNRAVEAAPSPTIWNNVAYELSRKKAHLDVARRYAESAVTTVAAALRNVQLGQIGLRDLALVNALSAYWDTLGWVHFANGDLERAERYVSASWQLVPQGEVGDHLGQIYEKLGRKKEAIAAYAQALSGQRPLDESRERLAALLGTGAKEVSREVNKHIDAQQGFRTIRLGKATRIAGTADFFVLIEPGKQGAVATEVRFLKGEPRLKSLGDKLLAAKYTLEFPDDTPTKIPRRGTLHCSSVTGDCIFVMLLPGDVHSVE